MIPLVCPHYAFPSSSWDTSMTHHQRPKTHPAGLDHIPVVSIPLVRSRICSKAEFGAVYPDTSNSQGVQPQSPRISPRRAPVCWMGKEQHFPSSKALGSAWNCFHEGLHYSQLPSLKLGEGGGSWNLSELAVREMNGFFSQE